MIDDIDVLVQTASLVPLPGQENAEITKKTKEDKKRKEISEKPKTRKRKCMIGIFYPTIIFSQNLLKNVEIYKIKLHFLYLPTTYQLVWLKNVEKV